MVRTYKVYGRNKNYIAGPISEQFQLNEVLKGCVGYTANGKNKCYKKRGMISNGKDTYEGPYPKKHKGKSYTLPNILYEQACIWILKHSEDNTEWEMKYEAYVESFSNSFVIGKTDTRKPDDYQMIKGTNFGRRDDQI
ncbi:hypothetical protein MKX01_014418, partial [Papaver californicum]